MAGRQARWICTEPASRELTGLGSSKARKSPKIIFRLVVTPGQVRSTVARYRNLFVQVTRYKVGFGDLDLQVTAGDDSAPVTGSIPVRLRSDRRRLPR